MTENASRHLAPVDPYDGEPPQDGPEIIAEQAVLGSAIQSSEAAAEALALLRPEYFSRTVHQVVFEAVGRLAGAGDPVEPVSVMSELSRAGMLAKIRSRDLGTGGVFLHSLMQHAGSVAYHAPKIIAAARQRNLRNALTSCEAIAAREEFDPDVHLEQIRTLIDEASAFAAPAPLRPNSEAVLRVLDALQAGTEPGISTGYPDLDDAIGGLRPASLIVVGARPGVGKTQLGFCIADHVGTRLSLPALFASLEMTEDELTERRISAASKVPMFDIVRHRVSDAEWEMIRRAQDRLLNTQLYVDDTSGVSLAHIRGRLRAMARTGTPARLAVIDYLGFMDAPKSESRQQAVAGLARGAKSLAREFAIPVILLAQLNRGPESRSDKAPVASDLRESGEIEQTADIVILLHREDAYEPESPRAGEIDLIVRKNRQGPLCTITMGFQGHYGRIVSMAPDWTPVSALDSTR